MPAGERIGRALAPPAGALVLLPLLLWDLLRHVLRARGDRSPARRQELLRHFSEQDLATGRAHAVRPGQLFPLQQGLLYLFFGVVLFGGLGAALEQRCLAQAGGAWPLALPPFLLALLGGSGLLQLPLAAYREFVIQRQAGLSTITPLTWAADQVKALALGWALASLLALPVMALVRWLPALWPLPAAAAVLAISAFTVWISPWLLAPLFNRFTPLRDPDLASVLQGMLQEAGLPGAQLFVMDASRRSSTLNAYFTGLGSSRRVVLFDTLLRDCPVEEVLSVVAHELGHWRGRHIAKSFALQAAGVLGGLGLLQLLLAHPGARALLGVPAPDSLVLLPLLPLLGSMAALLSAPLAAALSRRFERQADRAALELTRDPLAFVRLQQRLVRRAKADLLRHPLLHQWYGSHPLPEERIRAALAFARQADAEAFGPPLE